MKLYAYTNKELLNVLDTLALKLGRHNYIHHTNSWNKGNVYIGRYCHVFKTVYRSRYHQEQ